MVLGHYRPIFFIVVFVGFIFFNRYEVDGETESWKGPWILMSIATSIKLFQTPFNSILIGLGKVKEMNKVLFFQQLFIPTTLVLGLFLGMKLYVVGLSILVGVCTWFSSVIKSHHFLILYNLWIHPITEKISFLNAGIAEQNMAGVAAGLAMTGYNVYIYSIGNFPTLRCLEQIRNDIAYHKANVKIVSVGAGYAYGSLGATHQPTEEMGALRAIPNMIVATPGDPVEARAIARFSAGYEGPMYIRLGKAGEIIAHTEDSLIVKAGDILPIYLKDGNKKAVLACGNIMAATKSQILDQSLPYDLYSIPFVKPINIEQLKEIVEKYPDGLITIEEHQKSCGMGSTFVEEVNDLYAQSKLDKYPVIKRIAIPDEFAPVVGTQNFLREYEGLKL